MSVVEQELQEGAKAKVLDQATGVKGQDQEIEVVLEMAMGLDEVDVEGLGGTEEAIATEVKMVEVMDKVVVVGVDEEDEKVQLEV